MESHGNHGVSSDSPIRVHRRDGRTFAVSDDGHAIAEGANVAEAVDKLHDQLKIRQSLFVAAGLGAFPEKSPPYTPFLIKTAAVALAFVLVIVATDLVVSRAFSDLPRRAASFVFVTVDQLGQMSQWVSEERKREIGRSVRMLLENLQPVIEEVRPSLLSVQRPEAEPKSPEQ